MKPAFFACFLLLVNTCVAQTKTITRIKEKDTFILQRPISEAKEKMLLVDSLPKFKGDINKYIDNNIKNLQLVAQQKGTVKVHFTIDEYGLVKNPETLNAPDRKIDSIARNIVLDMPAWRPAIKDGKKIPSPYTLTINF